MKKTNIVFAVIFTVLVVITALSFFNAKIPTESGREAESTFKIGVVVPLSGRNARYGEWIQQGLNLAVEEINEDGGVMSRKIQLVYEDDQADPSQAVSALKRLIAKHDVQAVYGSWASSSVLAMAPVAEQEKVVILASAISPQITDAGDYIFRMQPSARKYIEPLIPFAYNTLDGRKLAILFINNDFGRDQADIFASAFEGLGGKVLLNEGYEPNSSDFRAEITKIRASGADTVFLAGYAEVAQILRQAPQIGLSDLNFIGSVPTENPDLFKIAGLASEGVVFPSHFDMNDTSATTQDFVNKYRNKYGVPPEGLAALAYDGLFALVAASENGGSFDADSIKNGLYKTKLEKGATGPTSFDGNGDIIKEIIIKTVSDQKFVPFSAK